MSAGEGFFMLERYSDRARQALVNAQANAYAIGHARIGAEHLLLTLAEDHQSVAVGCLGGLALAWKRCERLPNGLPAERSTLVCTGRSRRRQADQKKTGWSGTFEIGSKLPGDHIDIHGDQAATRRSTRHRGSRAVVQRRPVRGYAQSGWTADRPAPT
jgi:hypothetical protein